MILQTITEGNNRDTVVTTLDKIWQVQKHKPSLDSKAVKGLLLPLNVYI